MVDSIESRSYLNRLQILSISNKKQFKTWILLKVFFQSLIQLQHYFFPCDPTNKQDYLSRLPEVGKIYRSVMGRHFPAMALLQIVALVEDRFGEDREDDSNT